MSQGNGSSNSPSAQKNNAFSETIDEMGDWSEIMDISDSEFQEVLENVDQTGDPENLHKILDEILANCEINNLDKKVISTLLTDASKKFVQLIAEINKKLSGKRRNESDIKAKLKNCENILQCWQKCMNHLKKLKNVSITKIKSLPDILFNVVKSALSFCKTSEMICDDISNFSEEIAVIFQKSNEIMIVFVSIFDSVINFNVEQETELNILSSIINEIGDTAVMVNRSELKTIAGIWKQFGKLATIHSEKIKLKSPKCVIEHFHSLADDIVSLISSAVNSNQQKGNENKILCGKVLLKILHKLWTIYNLSVTDEIAHPIVKLLVQMYRYSSSCLISTNVDPSVIKFIEINISADLEAFFHLVFNNEHVLKAFFEFGKGENIDAVGYHLLTLNIMRKLIKSPYDIQRKWVFEETSILDVAFTNIDLLQLEICLRKLQITVTRNLGDSLKLLTIYQETLTLICGLICQVPPSNFGKIENVLVKYLMSGNFWSSLLVVDTWCIISRCTSTELCYDHLKYLLKVHDRLSERKNSLEVFFLSFLIRRIYRTLSESKKNLFVEHLDGSDPDFWNPLSSVLTNKGKSILQKRTVESGNDISRNFHLLTQNPSIKSWTGFTSLLNMTEICSREQDKQTMNTLSNILNSISEVLEFCEGSNFILVSELMIDIFRCHFPCRESFSDGTMCSILKSLRSLLPYALPYVRVQLLNWLKHILIHTRDKISHLSAPISELYIKLLQDEALWVRQEAFDNFKDFTNTNNSLNEDLLERVLNIIDDKTTLLESLSAYINGTSYCKLSGFSNSEKYLRQLLGSSRKTLHQHAYYEVSEREEKVPKLENFEEDSATDTGSKVDEKIENICNELDSLVKYKNEISQKSLERLRQTFLKICDQRVNSS